ncbi:unnamed protein product [Effrenium voratum]|nr:unnamed protein product [Effrenium voratum]
MQGGQRPHLEDNRHVPGLTDRRYEGVIARYLAEKGFGFIRCAELRQRFPDRDIFLHQKQLGNFKEGDTVTFGIFLNKDGKPYATDLAPLNGDMQGMQGMQGVQMGMPQMGMAVPGQQAVGNMPASAPLPPPPQVVEEEGVHEVEVPKDIASQWGDSSWGRLQELKQMAGGDINITLQVRADYTNVAVVRGPKAHASLGAILVMQELCDLVQIPL